jgi:hypothetical protein
MFLTPKRESERWTEKKVGGNACDIVNASFKFSMKILRKTTNLLNMTADTTAEIQTRYIQKYRSKLLPLHQSPGSAHEIWCHDNKYKWHGTGLYTNSVAPEPEGSSPHSQQPASGPYPLHTPPTNLPKVHFDPILPSTAWSFKWSFPWGFPTKTLYTFLPSPMRATCTAHLILLDWSA